MNCRLGKEGKNQRGIALLVTLAVISVMIVSVFELNRNVFDIVEHTDALRSRVLLEQVAASGVHGAMALLVRDKMDSQTDTLQEDWANEERIAELLQSMPFERGKLAVGITDELSRIQVNAVVRFPEKNQPNDAQMFLLERFLSLFLGDDTEAEEERPRAIVNSVKDWIDSGDDDAITGLSGAESDHYRSLAPPYEARNGPLSVAEELLQVKGVSSELFFGSQEKPGIGAYVTAHGLLQTGGAGSFPGRINIGTAPLSTLQAMLPDGFEPLAQEIHDYRTDFSTDRYVNDISGSSWYTNVPGFQMLTGEDLQDFQSLVATASDIFRIESSASVQEQRLTIQAVVERIQDGETGKWKCRVLQWKTAEQPVSEKPHQP